MPLFRYEAVNSSGKISRGVHPAETVADVEAWLAKNGLSPIDIQATSASESAQGARPSLFDRITGIRLDDRILFCRQMATMLGAGVSLLQALRVIRRQVQNPLLRQIIEAVATAIEGGASLSEALSAHPKAFNQLFVNIVQVGEETGSLDISFKYLADLFENEKIIKERIKAATRYPKIVVTALVVAVIFLMTFVVPKFAQLFQSANVPLPLPTRILMTVSGFFTEYGLLLLLGTVGLIAGYQVAMRYEQAALVRDRLLLKIPVFGQLALKVAMSRFCRVLAVLTASGIDIIRSLDLAASGLPNLLLRQTMAEIRHDVAAGVSLAEAAGRHQLLPPLVIEMIAVGEEAGDLEGMMHRVADFYDTESEYTIKNLSTLIEPLLLMVLATVVAMIALAVFMPMWNMLQVARGG